MAVTIYHNSRCSTSRRTLDYIRAAGVEPNIVNYLETPPTRAELADLIGQMGLQPADVVRRKEALFGELGLADAGPDELLEAMAAHPILIERPIVVSPSGVRLCRPAEKVGEIVAGAGRPPSGA
jgi:arsenate reductase